MFVICYSGQSLHGVHFLLGCASLAEISCICHVAALSVIIIVVGTTAATPNAVYTPDASYIRLSNAELACEMSL